MVQSQGRPRDTGTAPDETSKPGFVTGHRLTMEKEAKPRQNGNLRYLGEEGSFSE